MGTLIEKMLETPDVELLISKIQETLANEKKSREAFYEWITEDVKAEFINGEIVIYSPVKQGHLDVSGNLSDLLRMFVKLHKLGKTSVEKGLVSLTRNDYEPDLCFWGHEKSADFTEDTLKHPAPDFTIEILSKGTKSNDTGTKFRDYAAHGVQEYWIVDYKKKTVKQYYLANPGDTAFTLKRSLGLEDTIESEVIKGFTFPVKAIFDDDENLKVQRKWMQP